MSPLSRPLTGENLTFSMAQHITQLRQDDSYMRSGRAGRTLVKAGILRLTLTVLADGVEVGTHHAEAPMTVHVLEGGLRYRVDDEDFELGRDQVLFFGPGHAQDIRALGDTSLLLTITRAEEDENGAAEDGPLTRG
jgi:quercetin dioxygenase-like cupin family protein